MSVPGDEASKMRRRSQSGVTLLEFLIVIGIFAIVLASQLPGGVRNRAAGQVKACETNLTNMATAIAMYQSDYQVVPDSLESLVPKYLSTLRECPAAGRSTYEYRVMGSDFQLTCIGRFHKACYDVADRPSFHSASGLLPPEPELTSWFEWLIAGAPVICALLAWLLSLPFRRLPDFLRLTLIVAGIGGAMAAGSGKGADPFPPLLCILVAVAAGMANAVKEREDENLG